MNVVAPQPVRNSEFVQALATTLHRPAIFPSAGVCGDARLFGEMGESLLLASARVQPAKLEAAGYAFRYAELAEALCSALSES